MKKITIMIIAFIAFFAVALMTSIAVHRAINKDKGDADVATIIEGSAKKKSIKQGESEDENGHSIEEHKHLDEVTLGDMPEDLPGQMELDKEELRLKCQEYALGFGRGSGKVVFNNVETDKVDPTQLYYHFTLVTEDGNTYPFTIVKFYDFGEAMYDVQDGTVNDGMDERQEGYE